MGKTIRFLLTLLILGSINWLISIFFKVNFIDFSAPVGLFGVVIVYYFSSTGGFSSKYTNLLVQGETGIKIEETKKTFYLSFPFYGAILYFIVGVISTLIYYRSYFN